MIVVSDATPISTLLKVDQATLLKKLFDTVIIPEAVSEELMVFHPQIPDFVRVQSVTARHRRLSGTEKLGKGEAEAILLAKEVGADILLTDDRKARAAAPCEWHFGEIASCQEADRRLSGNQLGPVGRAILAGTKG